MARVVVGMSGGVDSSVAALLLKQQGHEVIGLFMRNWSDDSVILDDECPWIDDSRDAMLVAEHLNIPFQVIDLSETYKDRIVNYMFAEYEKGRTPNPDILCNREIKFDVFLKEALKLKADFVATGHYCQKEEIAIDGKPIYRLLAGKDKNKDQSYFLCQLSQEQLSKALFPIGHLEKEEVRRIAHEAGFTTADKKDSQGLCFVGKISLPEFLQQKLSTKSGEIIEIEPNNPQIPANIDNFSDIFNEIDQKPEYKKSDGKVIGKHQGAHFYTIGQRKGLNIGGTGEPMFVVQTDTINNLIFMGKGSEHPALFSKGLKVLPLNVHWVRDDLKLETGESASFKIRIRYRQPLEEATLFCTENGLYVVFEKPLKGITPGQFIAWYIDNELVGSGEIA